MFLSFNFVGAQIPNGDFENWAVGHLSRMEPVGWLTSDSLYTAATVTQDAGHSGTYSAKFTAVFDASAGNYKSGIIQVTHQTYTGGIRPDKLVGFLKLNGAGSSDYFAIDLRMYDGSNAQISHVSYGTPLGSNVPNWTQFTIPINYTNGNMAGNYTLQVSLWDFSSSPGISANLDDLAFDFNTGIASPNAATENYSILPPTGESNIFQLIGSKTNSVDVQVSVCDVAGRQVKSWTRSDFGKGDKLAMDLSSCTQGIYFCTIIDAVEQKSIRLIVR